MVSWVAGPAVYLHTDSGFMSAFSSACLLLDHKVINKDSYNFAFFYPSILLFQFSLLYPATCLALTFHSTSLSESFISHTYTLFLPLLSLLCL